MKQGFTLIELLVVVLIIGILSAVALPQYQKAVMKARTAEVELWLSTAGKALDLLYQENSSLADSCVAWYDENSIPSDNECVEALSVELPKAPKDWKCGITFGYLSCTGKKINSVALESTYGAFKEDISCVPFNLEEGYTDDKSVCKSLGYKKDNGFRLYK